MCGEMQLKYTCGEMQLKYTCAEITIEVHVCWNAIEVHVWWNAIANADSEWRPGWYNAEVQGYDNETGMSTVQQVSFRAWMHIYYWIDPFT